MSAPNEQEIARVWSQALDRTTYAPMSSAELDEYLGDLVARLLTALAADPFSAQPGAEVGARLVAANLRGPDSLPVTIEVLANCLLPAASEQRRVIDLLAAVAGGYASAIRRHTLNQQEQLSRALLAANNRVQAKLRATESRFREVFTSSAVGIAITDLSGVIVESNQALAGILGLRPDQLAGRRLADFVGEIGGRGRRELTRDDGDTAWIYLSTSVLTDGSGRPDYRVTMVQDLSELHLLQDRLGHQLVHDALTGLANRQLFTTRLETTLEQSPPDASITLCYLGLDAFSTVNSARGHQAGDRLLQTVAKRLQLTVAGEQALVARVAGDEFAVLIQDSPGTPGIPELIEQIKLELSEPTYVDGHAVAVGASVGVVRQQAGSTSSAELFRAADVALRAAKTAGKRQWVRYDPHQDATARHADQLATQLPAAWENGELGLRYLPVVNLHHREVVGLRAVPSWMGQPCLELAERVGLSVALTAWILGEVCDPLAKPTRINLSRQQSGDADLIAAVRQAIESTGAAPDQLEIAFDTAALLDEHGDATDNLHVLSDLGTVTSLHAFTGGIRELTMLESLPARSVVLANVAGDGPAGPLGTRAAARLVSDLSTAGIRVAVDDVTDEPTATWWAGLGVHVATGPVFDEL